MRDGNDPSELEKTRLTLGIIPLIDCAPIVMAEALGTFERHGLDVEIRRESSWATIRDKVALGVLDAAQMLAPMPIAATLGLDITTPMIAAMSLDLNGNAVTLSQALWEEIAEASPDAARQTPLASSALRPVIERRRARGRALKLASVFPFSTHNYLLRLWLGAGGIDPDRDVQLSVVPPPHTIAHLSAGAIDGYCVGEPWNQQAVALGIGRVAVTGFDIWKAAPEKVLGTTEAWARRHPNTLTALIKALIEACVWLDDPANRGEAARVLASPGLVNAPVDVIERSLTGSYLYHLAGAAASLPDFHVFHRSAANFPWRSHAEWFIAQMQRWGQAPNHIDVCAIADRVFRTDLYRAAAMSLGVPCPTVDRKIEGAHAAPWTLTDATLPIAMGADAFLDGAVFTPRATAELTPTTSASRDARGAT